jgi:leucyl aminopeptidase
MANGLDIKVEFKEKIEASDTAVVLLHKWPEKGAPSSSFFSRELADLAAAGLITGESGSRSIHLISGSAATKLIVIGLGEKGKESSETFRAAAGALVGLVKQNKLSSVAVLNAADPAAVASGFLLAGFNYRDYKGTGTKPDKDPTSVKLKFVGNYPAAQHSEIQRAVIIAEAQNYARTIASRPGNDINPPSLAKVAQDLAKEVGLGVTVLDEKQMKKLGMGGILGVGAGSNTTPPRMIALHYCPPHPKHRGTPEQLEKILTEKFGAQLLVVGKAITFDTGGISIKDALGMQRMIFDKCGGMAVLGLMRALAKLKLPVRVVGILASAENHISETAYRPGDILKMYNGVTVEVTNTDAEGRLVLGDALAWGIETFKPAAVIDLATLTGAVVIALGKTYAGVMSNNDQIVDELQSASKSAGEKIWRLPIGDEHRDMLKSDYADIMNSGPTRDAGTLKGGAFLSYFVPENIPWAHLDIAGVAAIETPLPYYAKGATGWGVRTLVEWVTARIADKPQA